MAQLTGKERATYVQTMFTRIASHYDLMNRLMTGGQDIRWRKRVVELAQLDPDSSLLDIGTGTGELAREALRKFPRVKITAADFTIEMMCLGQRNSPLNFASADALCLPFRTSSFDAVVSGFLIRNVIDLQKALQEQYRVLRKGGRIVILDTTRPKKNILSPFIRIHIYVIIPAFGSVLTGSKEAYRYLSETTEHFITAEELASRMMTIGFRNVNFKRYMLGTIAIHWGEK